MIMFTVYVFGFLFHMDCHVLFPSCFLSIIVCFGLFLHLACQQILSSLEAFSFGHVLMRPRWWYQCHLLQRPCSCFALLWQLYKQDFLVPYINPDVPTLGCCNIPAWGLLSFSLSHAIPRIMLLLQRAEVFSYFQEWAAAEPHNGGNLGAIGAACGTMWNYRGTMWMTLQGSLICEEWK